MARLARIVLPGIPYHVTQRGNRRQRTFFNDADYALYRDLLAAAAKRAGTSVWAYCLMPNHVHLIVVPVDEDGLRRTFADAHRRYTGFVNARERWTGHLWQGRYGAVAMDEAHLAAAARYVALNPVRAGLVSAAHEWRWSSVRAHLAGIDDPRLKLRRCSSATATSAHFWAERRTSRRRAPCGFPKPPDGQPASPRGSARSSAAPAASSRRESAGRKRN